MALTEISDANQDGNECRLAIDGEFNIYVALEIKQSLENLLPKFQSFVLDLSAVTDVDSSGIQILLAFNKAAKSADKTFAVFQPSPTIISLLDLYQANDQINLLEEVD